MAKYRNTEELIELIENSDSSVKSYGKEVVVKMLKALEKRETFRPPSRLKKGDVFTDRVGSKVRPVVIAKVVGDTVTGIPLSTTEDELNLMESSSRFFGDSYFSKGIVVAKYSYAMEYFIGVYDNEKLLRKAIKESKKFLMDNL